MGLSKVCYGLLRFSKKKPLRELLTRALNAPVIASQEQLKVAKVGLQQQFR